jgi:predicted RNA-binding protein with PIN domain
MHYLVDAYNLLFRSLKKRGPLENTRQKLISELNEVVSQLNMQVTLVFDGADEHLPHSTRGHFDALQIVYTPKSKTADEYISEEVAISKAPASITVVTNDRELAHRCKAYRAKIQTIDQFLAFLMKKKAKKKKLSSNSAKAFRDSDPEIARLLTIFEKKVLENLKNLYQE